jgi:hypothetical protein
MVDQAIKQQVFISYSRKDINFARRLAADLEEAGFDVWWDISDLKGGDDWVRFIPAAIQASQYFVVLLSPNSVQSEWVAKEYSYALRLHKKVVPAMIKPSEVPFALNTINYVDFVHEDYDTAINKLLRALGGAPRAVPPATGWKKFSRNLPPVVAANPWLWIGGAIVLLAILLFSFLKPATPVPLPATATPTRTAVLTNTPPPVVSTDTQTAEPSPTPTITSTFTQTFTPTISATPSMTPTKTPAPANFVLPTVCVSPTAFDVQAVWVRTGPPNSLGTPSGVLPSAPAIEVGRCPLIGGQNVEGTPWLMIAYSQTATQYVPYEGGWVSKELFDLRTPVFIPEVTLTFTPTITLTPTVTATFTPTPSLTPTATFTATPTRTSTPTATDTPTPTYTSLPTLEPEATNSP